ncbi:unnamed protein product [Larinioides sclopetarius]|uniref:Uncharacterized protein n=1 Tax=Larinioides sclopetarius TaxID=280406 RepID=A0AAV2AHV5_9ARAC
MALLQRMEEVPRPKWHRLNRTPNVRFGYTERNGPYEKTRNRWHEMFKETGTLLTFPEVEGLVSVKQLLNSFGNQQSSTKSTRQASQLQISQTSLANGKLGDEPTFRRRNEFGLGMVALILLFKDSLYCLKKIFSTSGNF